MPLKVKSITLKEKNWLLEQIRSDNQKVIRDAYEQHLSEIAGWFMKNHGCSKDDAVEVYHRAFIIFYENIVEKKLTHLTSDLKSYLFAVTKNIYRERFKYSRFYNSSMDNEEVVTGIDISIDQKYDEDDRKSTVKQIINSLKEPCKTIIRLAFFRNYSNEAIANHLNYKNESIARTGKARCLARMRKLLAESNPVI